MDTSRLERHTAYVINDFALLDQKFRAIFSKFAENRIPLLFRADYLAVGGGCVSLMYGVYLIKPLDADFEVRLLDDSAIALTRFMDDKSVPILVGIDSFSFGFERGFFNKYAHVLGLTAQRLKDQLRQFNQVFLDYQEPGSTLYSDTTLKLIRHSLVTDVERLQNLKKEIEIGLAYIDAMILLRGNGY